MKGYKDFKCSDKQYEVGKEFSTDLKMEIQSLRILTKILRIL